MDFHRSTVFPYQPCDSYFVQTLDEDKMSYLEQQEQAIIIAKERQLIVAEEISKSTSDEYLEDIKAHLDVMERATLPDVSSMDQQPEIEWYMRPFLLDFLIEAHGAFKLLPDTLFLMVNLVDRYCSNRIVYKRHYQLVGCAALLVAAKYNDKKDRPPTIPELNGMCCSNYDNHMFEQMERHLLETVQWTLGHPTVDAFLELAVAEDAYDPEVEHMARYVAEMAMYHREFVSVKASVMARVALRLAKFILQREDASVLELDHETDEKSFETCIAVNLLCELHQPSEILSQKYASSQLSSVAVLLERFLEQARVEQARARMAAPISPPDEQVHEAVRVGLPPPQTPQKPGLLAIPHGVHTPPISPDGDDGPYVGAYEVDHPPTHLYPSTPSSSPDVVMYDGSAFNA
ncbi:MAG: hypothetical protein M1816_000405 [Peltula sp. TS41687]|nr:MAG: hypothetical protein M1816_000405 [Peltula sp. TS41687]